MIVKYIRELLKDHDRVIIPNFGAFLKSKGEIKKIIFNEFIKFNDGQLINLISEKEGFPVSDASKRVDDFVEKIKGELSEEEKIEFEGIGYLYKDDNGRIRFTDYGQETIEADALAGGTAQVEMEGKTASKAEESKEETKTEAETKTPDAKAQKEEKLEEHEAPEKKKEEPAKPKVEKGKPVPSSKVEVKSTPEPKTEQPKDMGTKPDPEKIAQQDPRTRQKEPVSPGRKKMIIWLLVIFIPLVAFGVYVIIDYQNVKNFLTSEKVEADEPVDRELVPVEDMEQAKMTSEESKPEGRSEEQAAVEQQAPEQPTAAEQPEEKEESHQQVREREQAGETQPQETQYVPPKKYHLIAGVFSDKQNAEKKVKQLKEEGFYAEIVGRINDKYYVNYNSFKKKQDAAYEKDRLIEKGYDTWIYYY
ncbi:MAG: SPOR domain-containing protein [Bacteroidales bacterium]|nr:SPOR domain-containing protein [Bacteroidales bacterium]MCF8376264.1 SPOR domain-containing protein [Bacteroidales bacterium]MCF8401925.1 SPOR domain-containing protein [Bacteroidales bacterium]